MTLPSNGTVATMADERVDLATEINHYIARRLTTDAAEFINGKFFEVQAEVRPDGYIPVTIRRINFEGADCVIQTLLHPTAPVIVAASDPEPTPALPTGIGSLDLPPDAAA